ncbi:MAG: intradiol ring-cleavage dioxygenase [Chloroflexota bacterium]
MARSRIPLSTVALVVALISGAARSAPVSAQDSPRCVVGELTRASTPGPFFKAGSPERASLLDADVSGRRLLLSGSVLDSTCAAIPGARVDFWQADAAGSYDLRGYRLRGHQFTDADGRYSLETIVPAEYTGRTSHLHVTVTPPGGAPFTTQLYFPGVDRNATDFLFDAGLLMQAEPQGEDILGRFDFVVRGVGG